MTLSELVEAVLEVEAWRIAEDEEQPLSLRQTAFELFVVPHTRRRVMALLVCGPIVT